MTKTEEMRAGTRIREKLGRQFDIPPAWPLRIDWATMEYYDPLERYLTQLRKRRATALFAAIHSVIEAERRGWK
jgi:hypothetical protein